MPATAAIEGYGTTVAYSTDAGTTWLTVAEAKKIGGPNFEAKELNASNLLSPNGFEEFISGMVNAGEITIDANWIKTSVASLVALFRTSIQLKITFTTASTWVATSCFIAKMGEEIPHDDVITMSVTFKISGKPTFTP